MQCQRLLCASWRDSVFLHRGVICAGSDPCLCLRPYCADRSQWLAGLSTRCLAQVQITPRCSLVNQAIGIAGLRFRPRWAGRLLLSTTRIAGVVLTSEPDHEVPVMEEKSLDDQLKAAFAAINKEACKRDRKAARKLKKKRVKDLARAVRRNEELISSIEKSRQTRPCSECGKATRADPDFFLNPVQCEDCKSWSAQGRSRQNRTQFSASTVVQGGAPGLGKRS